MKYSQSLVWKACDDILPSIAKARKTIHFNLPKILEMAAVECFLMQDDVDFRLSKDLTWAAYIVRVALKELNTQGKMTFGDVEEYWM
jgi:hypothetical protein